MKPQPVMEKMAIFTTLEYLPKLNTNLLAERLFPSTEFSPGYPLQSRVQHVHTTKKIVLFLFHAFLDEFLQQRTLCCSLVTKHNASYINKLRHFSVFCGQTSELIIASPILTQLKAYDFSDRAKTDCVRTS